MISKEINEDNEDIEYDNEYDNDDSVVDIVKKIKFLKIQEINLSEYEKGDLLGYGCNAKIYIARKKTDREYAVKIFKKEPNSLKKFFRELDICSRISHLSLKNLHGYSLSGFDKNDGPMLFTKYYCNNSLDTLLELERKRKVSDIWTDTQKMIIVYGVARGMKYLHSLNILYKNLKPSSILLDEYFHPHISYFDQPDDHKSVELNYHYTAPEILKGEHFTQNSDVYSFGALVYDIFKGINDSNPASEKELLENNQTIPNALQDLIERCLNEDPNQRPSFEQIINEFNTNKEFITDKIDEKQYRSYIELSEEGEKGIDKKLKEYEISSKYSIEPINDKYKSVIQQDEKEEEEKLINQLQALNIKQIDLNKFEIVKTLGSGGYSDVVLIKNKETGKLYASKRMDKKKRSTFLQELKILSELHHPLIVNLVGYSLRDCEQNPIYNIVIEFISNGSLYDILNNERNKINIEQWNETMKLINIYGIASAMKYIHSHDIVHCDLKPSNILINEFFFPIICDFGLSLKTTIDQTIYEDFRGTAAYCSPESFESGIYTKKYDVYSFGMILYEIMTKEYPFKGLDFSQVCYKILNQRARPKLNKFVPKKFKEIIKKCWDEDPNKRPSFDQIVYELKTDDDFITDKIDKNLFFHLFKYLIEKNTCMKTLLDVYTRKMIYIKSLKHQIQKLHLLILK